MKKLNVVFYDGSAVLGQDAVSFFADDADINLVSVSHPATDLGFDAEVAILDVDAPAFREALHTYSAKSAKIVLTSRHIDDGRALPAHDAMFYKPYSFLEIRSRLLKFLSAKSSGVTIKIGTNRALDEKLSNIFIRAGIPPHIKGYQFLREAVKLAVAQPDMINAITKRLYPAVAEAHNTSSSKVERAIRHAIEVAWNRGKIENINAIFGIKIYGKGEKPTNGELIALLADKLIIESY